MPTEEAHAVAEWEARIGHGVAAFIRDRLESHPPLGRTQVACDFRNWALGLAIDANKRLVVGVGYRCSSRVNRPESTHSVGGSSE